MIGLASLTISKFRRLICAFPVIAVFWAIVVCAAATPANPPAEPAIVSKPVVRAPDVTLADVSATVVSEVPPASTAATEAAASGFPLKICGDIPQNLHFGLSAIFR
jgi:hypothetical protein